MPDRILVRPELARHRLADDHRELAIGAIELVEIAAGDQAHPCRMNEPGRHDPNRHDGLLRQRQPGLPLDGKREVRSALERQRVAGGRRLDARQCPNAAEHLVDKRHPLFALIGAAGQRDVHRQQVPRVEAGIDGAKLDERAEQQARAGQQHQRQRHFADDERVADPPLGGRRARPSDALFQGVVGVGAREAPRRHEAGEHRRRDGDGACEDEDRRVQRDFAKPRKELGNRCGQQPQAQPPRQQPEEGAAGRQQQRFGEHLLNDAQPAGAKRGAHRQFARSPERLGEQQVGEVRRSNEDDEDDGAEEEQKWQAHVADDVLVKRHDERAPSLVVLRVLPLEPLRDRRHLGLRGVHVDAGTQVADDEVRVIASDGALLGCPHEGHPEVDVLGKRRALRHDADNGVRLAVEGDGPPDRGRVGAKACPPGAFAQQDGARRVGCLIGGTQRSPQRAAARRGC